MGVCSKAKESTYSRAYFNFKTMETLFAFHQNFDGHIFIDNKGKTKTHIIFSLVMETCEYPVFRSLNIFSGNEHRVVVEFAPFQKIPKEIKKPDPRQGTIETGT